jgi:hypothetical protein
MARYLEVRGGRGRNPDLRPGRRNHEAGDAVQRFRVAYFLAFRVVVGEVAGAGRLAGQAGALVGGVAQAGHFGLPGGVFVHNMRFFLRLKQLFAGFGVGSGGHG